ncbi:DUF2306 domain-containing protein [Pseudokordiimonas caeni]|uniref:DUF2306 domain-containing protein n=1 Tax=Pseudokordiimonas caeni TaxID=2997908 RepID=UPI00281127D3|nr:DUF2306 domain-containing protein [Pseudokordiimonas caeni]
MTRRLYILMLLVAGATAILSWRFFLGIWPDDSEPAGFHLHHNTLGAFFHFVFSPLALLVGGFQFSARLRTRWPIVHRGTGWLYVISCLLGAAGSIALALNSPSSGIASTGFLLLAAGWIITPVMAVVAISRRDQLQHRIWMIRSFALTLAAVTLRFYLVFFMVATGGAEGAAFDSAYTAIAWLCWIPNLTLAEYLIVRPLKAGK